MFIGTQFYRKPHPPQADWAHDLTNIAQSGVRLVRYWVYWSQVNPRPDQWIWDDLDALFDMAAENDLKVLVQLMPDSMPIWFRDQHPEALLRDANDKLLMPIAHAAMGGGGIPGPNFDHPATREAVETFFTAIVARYREHPALYAWDVWNELWPFMGAHRAAFYGDATIAKWRTWLQQRYGSIEALNQHWNRVYGSFEEIEWVTEGTYADLGTRLKFDTERVADWMHWRVNLLRRLDPDHLAAAHTGGIGPVSALNDPWGGELTDPWLFTESLDVWGVSIYLHDFYQWSFALDSSRSACQGREFWVFEMNGGRGHYAHPGTPGPGFYSNYRRTKEEIRSQVLLTFGHGGNGAVFWQWRPEHFGAESPGWGLASASGELTERTEALREIEAMISSHSDLFDALTFPEPQVAILWNPRSYQAERLARWQPGFGYLGGFELFGYHRALSDLGLRVEYLHTDKVTERGIPPSIKLLIHPYPVVDTDGLAGRISEWANEGGTFVAGPGVGLFDDKLDGAFQVPPTAWQTLLGVREAEMDYSNEPNVELLPVAANGSAQRLPGYHLIQSFYLNGAEPLGVWGQRVALTSNTVGQGRAIAAGTFFGQPHSVSGKDSLGTWISALCHVAGVTQPVRVTSPHLFSRIAQSGDTALIFVHNPAREPASGWISVDAAGDSTVTNLLDGRQIGRVAGGQPVAFSLAALDSTVLAIHTTP